MSVASAALRFAFATSRWLMRVSKVSLLVWPSLMRRLARSNSCSANLSWALAWAMEASAAATWLLALATSALARKSCALSCAVSMSANVWFRFTRSPSLAEISFTRPAILVEISTWTASIRPLPKTIPSGSWLLLLLLKNRYAMPPNKTSPPIANDLLICIQISPRKAVLLHISGEMVVYAKSKRIDIAQVLFRLALFCLDNARYRPNQCDG